MEFTESSSNKNSYFFSLDNVDTTRNLSSLFLKFYQDLNNRLFLSLNLMINQLNLVYDFVQHQLSEYNIPETYIIGAVLSTIVVILWCLLRRKRRRLKIQNEQVQTPSTSTSTASTSLSKQSASKSVKSSSSASKPKYTNGSSNNDDGYLSDSALSFFSRLSNNNGPRFRKRDKLYFYGKKMLRTVSHVRGSLSARSAEKSKNIYKILQNKILNSKDVENQPQYRRTELPEFLLDIESSNQKSDHDLPSALINLFRSVKVFGYFDQKIILEMCKYMETKTVYANNYLFKIGEPDDSIYVVESGRVNVYVTDEKGRKHLMKECTDGNHIFSLLSIMDVLTGDLKSYKTVSAKAVEDTTILRLPGKAFVDVLNKYPEYLVRITQIIIVRLQRVTFTALHNYLGLTSEIIRSSNLKRHLKSSRRNSTSNNNNNMDALKDANETKSNKTNKKHYYHHHHHHHHHYHSAKQKNLNKEMSLQLNQNTESGTDFYESSRKPSLPPVGFFAEDSDVY